MLDAMLGTGFKSLLRKRLTFFSAHIRKGLAYCLSSWPLAFAVFADRRFR